MPALTNVGFIDLGVMGLPMAAHVLDRLPGSPSGSGRGDQSRRSRCRQQAR